MLSQPRKLVTQALPFLICFFGCFTQLSAQVLSAATKDSIIKLLFEVDHDDQKYRNQMESLAAMHGAESKEMAELLLNMKIADSLNLLKVVSIIETYGWLGEHEIGSQCNTTLFMVIQHSDLKTQLKYLPKMREAVKKGNARAGSLALLEDRVAIYQGNKQIYGSQISYNMKTKQYYVIPIEDPDHVDKRRAEMHLGPLAEYVQECCGLVWNLEEYKKDLPTIEAEFFKKK